MLLSFYSWEHLRSMLECSSIFQSDWGDVLSGQSGVRGKRFILIKDTGWLPSYTASPLFSESTTSRSLQLMEEVTVILGVQPSWRSLTHLNQDSRLLNVYQIWRKSIWLLEATKDNCCETGPITLNNLRPLDTVLDAQSCSFNLPIVFNRVLQHKTVVFISHCILWLDDSAHGRRPSGQHFELITIRPESPGRRMCIIKLLPTSSDAASSFIQPSSSDYGDGLQKLKGI